MVKQALILSISLCLSCLSSFDRVLASEDDLQNDAVPQDDFGESTFRIQRLLFTTGCTMGYREFALRPDNVFKAGAPMNLYIEPENCRLYPTGVSYTAKLTASAIIESLSRPGIANTIDLGELKFVLRKNDTPLYADLTLNGAGDLPLDLYRITVVLVDQKSNAQAICSRMFRVGHSYVKAALSAENTGDGTNSQVIFKQSPAPVYCRFQVRQLFAASTIKFSLIAERVAGLELESLIDTFVTSKARKDEDIIEFKPEAGDWQKGIYRVEIFLDEAFEQALQFRVE